MLLFANKQLNSHTDILFKESVQNVSHATWVPCHHSKAHPQVSDKGDGIQILTAAANTLNKVVASSRQEVVLHLGFWAQ
jgi:hypothetical protein